jgi:oligopeptide transport system permease protein
MIRFLARRLAGGVVTVLLATFVFHTALTLLPGDPIRALFGAVRPSPEVYAAMRAQYHFDEPWYLQYLLYLGDLLRGDFGDSFPGATRRHIVHGPPVSDIIRGAFPVSARLLSAVLVVQTAVGVAMGTFMARWPRHTVATMYGGALLVVAMPVVVTAFVAQTVVGWQLQWLPVSGVSSGWTSYVLPVLTLSAASTGYVALLTQSELSETLHAPFIKTARSRSIPEPRIVAVHGLRPSLVPVVTFVAGNIGQLLTGLVIVEGVFGLPGVGQTLLGAIQARDPSLLIGLLVLITAFVVVASLVADVLQILIDPRVRHDAV